MTSKYKQTLVAGVASARGRPMLSAQLTSRAPFGARAHVDQRGTNADQYAARWQKYTPPCMTRGRGEGEGNEVRRSGPRARNIDQARNQAFRDTRSESSCRPQISLFSSCTDCTISYGLKGEEGHSPVSKFQIH